MAPTPSSSVESFALDAKCEEKQRSSADSPSSAEDFVFRIVAPLPTNGTPSRFLYAYSAREDPERDLQKFSENLLGMGESLTFHQIRKGGNGPQCGQDGKRVTSAPDDDPACLERHPIYRVLLPPPGQVSTETDIAEVHQHTSFSEEHAYLRDWIRGDGDSEWLMKRRIYMSNAAIGKSNRPVRDGFGRWSHVAAPFRTGTIREHRYWIPWLCLCGNARSKPYRASFDEIVEERWTTSWVGRTSSWIERAPNRSSLSEPVRWSVHKQSGRLYSVSAIGETSGKIWCRYELRSSVMVERVGGSGSDDCVDVGTVTLHDYEDMTLGVVRKLIFHSLVLAERVRRREKSS